MLARIVTITSHITHVQCSCSNSLACEFVNLRLAIQSNSIASRLPLLVSVKHVLEIINMKCARRDAVEKLIVFL